MRLLSVDPGTKGHGFAIWQEKELVSAGYCKRGDARALNGFFDVVVVEQPKVYPHSVKKDRKTGRVYVVDPNDMIELALAAGEVVGEVRSANPIVNVVYVLPQVWKSQLPKEIVAMRAMKLLTDVERRTIDLPRAKGLHHNVYDGVALGLYRLGRSRDGNHQYKG